VFPIEDDTSQVIKRMAFGDVTRIIIERIEKIIMDQKIDVFSNESEESKVTLPRKNSTIATAFMKAVCFTRGWIEEINIHKGGVSAAASDHY